MIKRQEYWIELAITLFLFVLINLFSQTFQRPISLNNGHGWDGALLLKVVEQLGNHGLPSAEAPFVYRLGTPLLVSLFSKRDLLLGFKIINTAGNMLTAVLFVFWLNLYLNDRKTRVLLVTFFLVMWHGPVRFVYYYQVYTDPWLFVMLLAGLIGIQQIQTSATVVRICLLGLVAFVGVIFRESAFMIPVAFLFCKDPIILSRKTSSALPSFQNKPVIESIPPTFFLPLGFAILGLLTVHLIASQNNEYSYIRTAIMWAYNKPALTYLHAWFIAFGPIIVIPIYYWRGTIRFLAKNQFILVYLLQFAVLAWIGGTDTERILFWGVPIVYLLVGKSIEDNAVLAKLIPFGLTILIVGQLISERVLWTIPDYPNEFSTPFPILTILSNNFQYLDLYSFHGSRAIHAISFIEYILLGVLIVWWLNDCEKELDPNRQ
ncbi:MAG: hypothetical protein WC647_12785 [Desulfomonilaceae bacterium]|jgi:hypothetical protein